MRRYPSLLIAAVLGILGSLLNATVRLPADYLSAPVGLVSTCVGQICWLLSLLMCLVRGNIYAEDNISEDGNGMLGFNLIKWGSVVVFLFADAFVAERAFERYFIFAHWQYVHGIYILR
jgi:hypothetical protein